MAQGNCLDQWRCRNCRWDWIDVPEVAKLRGLGTGAVVDRSVSSQYLHGCCACAIRRIAGQELGAMAPLALAVAAHLLGVALYARITSKFVGPECIRVRAVSMAPRFSVSMPCGSRPPVHHFPWVELKEVVPVSRPENEELSPAVYDCLFWAA